MREGWTYKKLGEVCEIFGRIGFRGYTREDYVDTIEKGAISLSPSNIVNNRLNFSNCTFITWDKYNQSPEIKIFEGDVIFVKTASVGKCAYVSELPHESTINPQFVVFKNIIISNRFLFYELLSPAFQYKVKRITSGTSVPTITQKGLSELNISYPIIEEQERIVAELDLLSSIIEKKKEQLSAYDQLAQSIFYDMFGDPITNEKGWEVKKLRDIGTIISGSTPRTNDDSLWDGTIDWVTPAELGEQLYYSSTVRKITEKGAKGLTLMPVGTVLLSSRAPIGKLAITKVPMCCNQGFKNIICNEELNNVFLYYYLYLTMERIIALGRGATFKEVSKKAIEAYSAIIPPLSLQQQFAERIEAIEQQKALVQASIAETETLFNSRMDYYFN